MNWPRYYATKAIERYSKEGRQAARLYVRDNVQQEWRELCWRHVENWIGLKGEDDE